MATNKTVFFLIGILLIVLGASMLAPYLLQVIFKEGSHSFVAASFVTMFIGILFILANIASFFFILFLITAKKVINFFKEDAPTMSMSGGGIAGSAETGDDPPVNKKKKKKRKRTPVGRYGSRRFWLQDLNGK